MAETPSSSAAPAQVVETEAAAPDPTGASRFGTSGTTFSIAAGAGIASLSVYFWMPFLPLYVQELGAQGDADTLFWVAIGNVALGLARMVSGPVWGIFSDRVGRKLMFVRALFFVTATTLIMAFAQEPWHIVLAFVCQGLFSGFIPAAVALTSVSVPDSKMSQALSIVTGAQYLGNTLGPALGAGLAIAFGFRGAIVAASLLPLVAAAVVMVLVPRDQVAAKPRVEEGAAKPNGPPLWRTLSMQFYLALFLYFLLFALNQLVRLSTPIALQDIQGNDDVAAAAGVAFTLGGVAAVAGVVFIGQRFVRPGRLRLTLIVASVVAAGAHVLLAVSHAVPMFIAAFALIALLQATMLPASNTLIAGNVPRERRGTGFGLAGSAQALAFLIGPMGAAGFAAVSIDLGFAVLGALFLGLALLLFVALREPSLEDAPV